jgi:hypothetical protein
MIVSVDLPPMTVARLQEEADTDQKSLEEYLNEILTAHSMPKPRNGAEQLALLEATGVVGLWADREDIGDSSEFAHALRKRAEKRDWS